MIYVHVPFCHRKCAYCAFYSVAGSTGKEAYIDALCREIAARHCFFGAAHWQPKTLYVGGGTPSSLSIGQLERIAEALRTHFDLSALQEATIECNPEDLTPEFIDNLHRINLFDRISIGIQSFDDNQLRRMNRRHTAEQARNAVRNAVQAGFRRVSIDLIYGLPNQSTTNWEHELYEVEKLNGTLSHPIGHLSCYALTLEPGTILERQVTNGQVTLAADDQQVEHYEALCRWCETAGYTQYEISNFAQPGQQSQHNSRYWNRTPYLGLGAAAHSFDGHCRRWNVADVARYTASAMAGPVEYEEEELTVRDAFNEYVMTALRTTAGIDRSQIPAPMTAHLDSAIQPFVDNAWITETATHYCPTPSGLLMADHMAAELFVTSPPQESEEAPVTEA